MRSAIYRGAVVHTRLSPRRHRLRYSVFSMLFDLDELDDLDRRFIPFGYNRAAPLAARRRRRSPTPTTIPRAPGRGKAGMALATAAPATPAAPAAPTARATLSEPAALAG